MRTFTKQCKKLQQKYHALILLPLFSIFFKIENFLKPHPKKQTSYLIFKATGGISHMLCGLAHCIEYAKKLGYFIIIDCKSATSFATEFKNLFYLENVAYSEDYASLSTEAQKVLPNNFSQHPARYITHNTTCKVDSEPPVFIKINEIQIKKQPVQFYAGLGRSISSHVLILLHHLKIQDSVKKELLKCQIKQTYIGVHFRNTDMKHDLAVILKELKNYLLKKKNLKLVYIATDDNQSIAKFKNFLAEFNQKTKRKIQCLYQKIIPSPKIGNTHELKEKNLLNDHGLTKINFHIQVLQDIFLLHHATFFIPSPQSRLSKFVIATRKRGQWFI